MSESSALHYPHSSHPSPGTTVELAPGVRWLTMPMGGSLNHINLWLLEDGDGWTIVDTCLNMPSARETWEGLFDGFMGGRRVNRVICTHLHPDHVGLAGWLTERFDCELWMSREEFLMCRTMAADTGIQAYWHWIGLHTRPDTKVYSWHQSGESSIAYWQRGFLSKEMLGYCDTNVITLDVQIDQCLIPLRYPD